MTFRLCLNTMTSSWLYAPSLTMQLRWRACMIHPGLLVSTTAILVNCCSIGWPPVTSHITHRTCTSRGSYNPQVTECTRHGTFIVAVNMWPTGHHGLYGMPGFLLTR